MDQLTTFFSMGSYGAYVWPSYLLTAAVMLSLLLTTLQRLRRNQAELAELESLKTVDKQQELQEKAVRS
ncbi:heme exporter protein CcmD [Kiloniella laminariae]|uniref:Heme exporter protein D n=1 Tax=Kiloniella laminariae TaxID=454162 RepID=A0ABT4LIN0_9PROT|nr:heme exporter protein CcmD [Kiloniella laminariae]MCZ4280937.1 heme exporter protein CcmD [Kiloniella laminariae]